MTASYLHPLCSLQIGTKKSPKTFFFHREIMIKINITHDSVFCTIQMISSINRFHHYIIPKTQLLAHLKNT